MKTYIYKPKKKIEIFATSENICHLEDFVCFATEYGLKLISEMPFNGGYIVIIEGATSDIDSLVENEIRHEGSQFFGLFKSVKTY